MRVWAPLIMGMGMAPCGCGHRCLLRAWAGSCALWFVGDVWAAAQVPAGMFALPLLPLGRWQWLGPATGMVPIASHLEQCIHPALAAART